MENINALTVNNDKFLNPTLQKVTDAIRSYDMNIRANQYAIAHHMARVEMEELYKQDGLESAIEWAEKAFGMKKSLAYSLITIGKEYTREYRNAKGKIIGYGSNIIAETADGSVPPCDYTANQIGRLATLGHDVVKQAHDNGEIRPQSTAKELQEYIKLHKAVKAGKSVDEPEQPTEPEQVTVDDVQDNAPEHEPAPAQMWTVEPRQEMFDNISTSWIIAEMRARGFIIYNGDGVEQRIDWKTVEGE